MKKGLNVFCFAACMLLAYAQASATDSYLTKAYQPATVVSVTKLNASPEFYYEIGIRMNCVLYVGRYKSASNSVPLPIAPLNQVDTRLEKHWMYVFLPPDRELEIRLVSATSSQDKSCRANPTGASASLIPAGTILPVTLNSTIGTSKQQKGTEITATLMQDVPLAGGTIIPAGSKVTGHMLDVVRAGDRSDESRVSFQFDQIEFANRTVPITANLRALASEAKVEAAEAPEAGGLEDWDGYWTPVQIGGSEAPYGEGGPVTLGSEVVGEYTSQGVLAHFTSDLSSECRGVVDRDRLPQAFWRFSVNACGAYGFGDVRIEHSGRTEPVGAVTLVSDSKAIKVGKGSAMLLRVDRSGSEETQARAANLQENH